jgi:hypothetical protein
LNISNHPSARWPETQVKIAQETYGQIEDLPFPMIDPTFNQEEVEQLALKFSEQVAKSEASAVHLMGEMCFTFNLVQKLKEMGLAVVASTTKRNVEEVNGKKIVQFEFVQFRPYF